MPRPAGTATYLALLRLPGALSAFAAATLLRLSYATLVLSLLFVVEGATGSFAVAGAAVGACALPSVLAPYKSRLVDRLGVRPTLTVLGVGYAAVLVVLVACAGAGISSPTGYLFLSGLAGILTPPVGPIMRGIWATLTPSSAERNRAYSLDAVAEESLFAVGPLLVGAVVAVADPQAALLMTAFLALIGSVVLAASPLARRGEVTTAGQLPRRLLGPLLLPGIRWVALAMLAVGFGLAPLEVAVAARAAEAGNPALAGYLLALLSLGSAAGGLAWGRMHHERRASTQLLALMGVLGVGTVAAGVAPSLPTLGLALALTGAVVAPAFVVAYVLADHMVEQRMRTEATTWVSTASNLGGAAGATTAGVVVEHLDAQAAFVVGGMTLIVLLPVLVITRHRALVGVGLRPARGAPWVAL